MATSPRREKAEIAQAAVTHFHFDHSSNLRWICDEFDAVLHIAPDTAQRIGEERLPPAPGLDVREGSLLDAGGGARLQALHTPGHSPESFCYYLADEGVLFSGDTILGSTTTSVHDLADYMQSLERLRSLPNLRVICPGHGPLIHNPVETIADYISHRNQREQQIVEVLSSGEALTSWQIMERIYTDVNPRLRRAADGNVRSHLGKLAKEGRVTQYAGTPRQPDASEVAERDAAESERREVMLKADEYREQARRRAVFLQENPPTAEWLEPPRYELA